VASYRQYCPLARASEILAERWSLLIVRNLMWGAATFNEIARGVPHMSRSMVIKRLRELEASGVITSSRKEEGRGSTDALTDAGRDLTGVIAEMVVWAERWVDVRPEHTDPGFALWAWCQVQLDHDALPAGRVVVGFTFPEERAGNRRFWLLVDGGDAEVCVSDPGGEPAAEVLARSRAFVDWQRGALPWAAALREGSITVHGSRAVARALPTWHRVLSPVRPAR
jgi:DNA-binding HxlR family transcriptional regulator